MNNQKQEFEAEFYKSQNDQIDDQFMEKQNVIFNIQKSNDIQIIIESDTDILFYLVCDITEDEYKQLKQEQNIQATYPETYDFIKNIIEHKILEPLNYTIQFVFDVDSNDVTCHFIQNFKNYKQLQILSLPFKVASLNEMHDHINEKLRNKEKNIKILDDKLQQLQSQATN